MTVQFERCCYLKCQEKYRRSCLVVLLLFSR